MRSMEESSAYSTAASMAQDIAVNVLSEQAANLTDSALSIFGLGSGSDTQEKYYQQVMQALTTIEGDLAQITAKLDKLSSGIAGIERTLVAISSQLTDAELQSRLAAYIPHVNLVAQNYQSYAAALAGMANAATVRQGTDALFSLFQPSNVNAVAVAMRNMRDLLVGSGELRGIISYQAAEVEPVYVLASDRPNMDGSRIVEAMPGALTAAFDQTIIPAMKAALAAQVKGISFLCAAWGGTINESELQTEVDGLAAVVAAMKKLFSQIDIDTMAGTMIKNYGPRVGQLDQPWVLSEGSDFWLWQPIFDQDWVFWGRSGDVRGSVVQAPWNYGTIEAYDVYDQGRNMVHNPDGSWTEVQYSANRAAPFTVPRPSATMQRPQNYASFLAALPA